MASKKIKIIIRTDGWRRLNLPALGICFLQRVAVLIFKIWCYQVRRDYEKGRQNNLAGLVNIQSDDIREVFNVLKSLEPMELVCVEDEKSNTYIKIYTK